MPLAQMAEPSCQPSQDHLKASPEAAAASQPTRFVVVLPHAPRFIGGVLILAGVLKAQALLTEPSVSARWLEIALVEAELICGLALALNFCPTLTRPLALALFVVLFVGAFYYVASGARSCACFGKVQLTPWIALLFDAAALVALWGWRPSRVPIGHLPGLLCLLPLGLFAVIPFAGSTVQFPRVILHPATLDVGQVVQARKVVVPLTAANPHDKPVTIESLESSCPCLLAPALPWVIGPRSKVSQEVVVALNEEPAFFGLLIVEMKGRTSDGNLAFAGRVRIRVVPVGSQISMK